MLWLAVKTQTHEGCSYVNESAGHSLMLFKRLSICKAFSIASIILVLRAIKFKSKWSVQGTAQRALHDAEQSHDAVWR